MLLLAQSLPFSETGHHLSQARPQAIKSPGDDDRPQESLLDIGVEARAALGLLEHLADLVEHGVRPQDLVADLAAQQDLLLVLRGKRLAKDHIKRRNRIFRFDKTDCSRHGLSPYSLPRGWRGPRNMVDWGIISDTEGRDEPYGMAPNPYRATAERPPP